MWANCSYLWRHGHLTSRYQQKTYTVIFKSEHVIEQYPKIKFRVKQSVTWLENMSCLIGINSLITFNVLLTQQTYFFFNNNNNDNNNNNNNNFDEGFLCDNPGLARLSFVNIFEDSRNHRSTLRIYYKNARRLLHERQKWDE